MSATSAHYAERLQRAHYTAWFSEFAEWTHALTVTSSPPLTKRPRSKFATVSAASHFISVLNRRVLGRRCVAKGHRIACAGVWGAGAYGVSPHVHLALQAPFGMAYEEMNLAIVDALEKTRGLGAEYDIKPYTSERWLEYMLDHGTDGLLIELISPAKH